MREVRDIVGMADVWWKHVFATLEDAGGERNDGRTPEVCEQDQRRLKTVSRLVFVGLHHFPISSTQVAH